MKFSFSVILVILTLSLAVRCKKLKQEDDSSMESNENSSGKRTLMVGKLVLAPILAGVGLKFLMLLPIVLSKIALLGILSFVSSNLSLLVSAITGIKSFLFDNDKPVPNDYDHDHHNPHYEYDGYAKSKGNAYDDHPGHKYKSHAYSDHKYKHNYYKNNEPSGHKKEFKAFRIIDHITDAIKDHIHNHKQKHKDHYGRDHDYDHKDPPDYIPHSEHIDDHDYKYKNNEHSYDHADYAKDHKNIDSAKHHKEDDDKLLQDWQQVKYNSEWKSKDPEEQHYKIQDDVSVVHNVANGFDVTLIPSYDAEKLASIHPLTNGPVAGYKIYENDLQNGLFTVQLQPQPVYSLVGQQQTDNIL